MPKRISRNISRKKFYSIGKRKRRPFKVTAGSTKRKVINDAKRDAR